VRRFPFGLALLGVLAVPGVCAASDPTGLFGAHVPLMSWAFDVGYMRSAGGWLWTSLAISIAGLMNAGVRALFPKPKAPEATACSDVRPKADSPFT